MSTIANMTGEDAPAAETVLPPVVAAGAAARPRPRSISLPAAITAALVAGMFGLLYLNLNGLSADIDTLRDEVRTEIGTLRSDMRSEIGTLRGEIGRVDAKVDDLRSEVSAILLDHTDRLARIETHLEIIRQPDAQATQLPQ